MTILEQIARTRTDDVVYSAIAITIEKFAAEAAREMLKDAAFRDALKALAQQGVQDTLRELRQPVRRRKKRKAAKGGRA